MDVLEQFRNEVECAVRAALEKMGQDLPFNAEVSDMADLAVPCFTMSKALRMAPKDIAEKLATEIEVKGLIASVEAVNGYLNFNITVDALVSGTVKAVITDREHFGDLPSKGKKIIVEHTSTNPTGPIHVGRARNPIIGDTLARCLSRCGYDVSTEYYVNDVGKQVVILTWGVNELPPQPTGSDERDKTDHRLVANYRVANAMMESDVAVQEQISDMLRRFEAGDSEVIGKVRKTAEAMLAGLKETLSGINVELDKYTWESDFIADGSARDVVERLKASSYAGTSDDGAWYVDLKDFGVQGKNTKFTFTRSDGTTLYTTRDLAYHLDKFKRGDIIIDVLGEDQKLGSKQLCSALEIMGEEGRPEALFYAFVSLPEGKMSTRKGVVVYLDDLIDESCERAYQEIKKRRTDMPEEKMREIARQVGVGAIRYNIVRVSPEKQFVFKWNDALNFDGNSGPYLQYVYARTCSLLKKAGSFEHDFDASKFKDETEINLIKILSRFSEAVRTSGEMRRVNMMPAYGHQLASAFNQFYAMVPVLGMSEYKNARLTLVECTNIVLKSVLDCLGMGAPEEM